MPGHEERNVREALLALGLGPDLQPIDFLQGLNDSAGGGFQGPQFPNDPGFIPGAQGDAALDKYETLIAFGASPEEALEIVFQEILGEEGGAGAGGGSALGFAQLAETQKNNAFNRVQDKLRLLSATDDLQESRRENAMFALLEAAPLLVAPGTEFSPGFEPGGPAMQLSNLIGANLQPQRLPTAELPIQDFLDAPTTVNPSLIEQQLGALQ